MDLNSIFDGIGTQLICGFFGLLIGGVGGYFLGVFRSINQKQKAGDGARQKQSAVIGVESDFEGKKKSNRIIESVVVQKQCAGDNSSQTQVGEIKNVK